LSKRGVRALVALGAAAFCLLALLNCGGYRYGIGDQAFYVPAVVQYLDASFFPRDRALLHVQDQFMAYFGIAAAVIRATGISLPVVSVAGYFAGMGLLFGAAVAIGRVMYRSWWTVALLGALLTMRHRITQTGANTLEAYFHPRMLACGLGLCAIASYLRGRGTWALAFIAAAFLMHPTTAVWFGIWVVTALAVSERHWRAPLIGLTSLAIAAFLWMVAFGPLRGHLATMDPRWASVLAGKDYIFPFDWTPLFWIVNLGYVAVVVAIFQFRRRRGIALPRETGLVAGALALVCLFLISVPWMRAWMALALQLQTSRVFWMLDLLTTVYVAWLLAEGASPRLRRGVVLAVLAITLARGAYVTLAERRGGRLVSVHLPNDNWTDAMRWLAQTPPGSHVLADPGHAWKYGTSVRVAGERDLYLEEVKDTALALYSRELAMRVLERIQDAHDFGAFTPERAQALAGKYDLNYLVLDHDIALPMVYRNSQFRIYLLSGALGPPARSTR
jgi:hypothetical protein